MSNELRVRTVAVAVIFDPKLGFLLWNNPGWNGFALPMKKMKSGDDPREVALAAVEELPISLPDVTASLLEEVGFALTSSSTGELTYYNHHVVAVDPGRTIDAEMLDNRELRFMLPANIASASDVTESTKKIVASLVESQEVVVAVLRRSGPTGPEFLLVNKPRGYFFPATRRKTHERLESLAEAAVRGDTGYAGPITAEFFRECELRRQGTRFGTSERVYRYYLCRVGTEGSPTGRWFSIDELRQGTGLSADVESLLTYVID